MIAFENISVVGWEPAIRGMRNPMNSWEKSGSLFFDYGDLDDKFVCHTITNKKKIVQPEEWNADITAKEMIGSSDLVLMKKLSAAGSDHAKFRRMIVVYMDITAPLYWWKEFDTYKVGTVANSCSTMHKIADKEFTIEDFSTEHLRSEEVECLQETIRFLNGNRELYLESKDKSDWWQMIQLLPSSYNQKRTVMVNYEVLANIYRSRRNHKLDEWHGLCKLITTSPYAEGIIFPELTEEEKLASDILLGDGSLYPVEGENGSD